LSSDIRSFEQKKKTLAAFLDISGAYANVLIDALCGNLCGLQLPLEMVSILWDLLHRRSLIFYHGGEAYTRRIGVKGLPRGSVLSPLLFIVGGPGIDVQMVRGVSLLQYADDLVIYASRFIVQRIRESLQKSLDAVSVFFIRCGILDVGFSRRPVESPPSLTMDGIGLPISKEFKYLGVVFDRGLTWNAHTK
jgi:hypothetical protein